MEKSSFWIQKAIKNKGAFTKFAKKVKGGFNKETEKITEKAISAGKKSKSTKTKKRAILAQTLRGLRK